MSGDLRVLVVDDLDELRTLISRALSHHGYAVDVAATIAQARDLRPGGYDAVLVDAHVGQERGIDLIDELRSEDPAAIRRCLIMTGGPAEALPAGVGCLAKPFRLDDLIEAVRALIEPGRGSVSGQPEVIAQDPDGYWSPAYRLGGHLPPLADARARQLLGLTRAVRSRERHELVDVLHDGAMQELTAATLELQMMSKSMAPGQAHAVSSVLQRLDSVGGSLRWLFERQWYVAVPETQLAAAIVQRTSWLLAGPPVVDSDEQAEQPDAIEVPIIADAVELMLMAMVPAGRPARAAVAVRTDEHVVRAELTITAVAEDGWPIGEAATVRAWLAALAGGLGCAVHAMLSDQQWRAVLVLPRQTSARARASTTSQPGPLEEIVEVPRRSQICHAP